MGMKIKTAWWLPKSQEVPYDHLTPLQGLHSQSKGNRASEGGQR